MYGKFANAKSMIKTIVADIIYNIPYDAQSIFKQRIVSTIEKTELYLFFVMP